MKPIIGISSNLNERVLSLSSDYVEAITKSGGVPIVIPNYQEEEEALKIVQLIDGLLLTGGGDIDPTLFGEEPQSGLGSISPERDASEITLTQKMLNLNKPILGICRGSQVLNIANGGDMYQDIYTQTENKNLLQHTQHAPRSHGSHYVQVYEGTKLSEIIHLEKFKVNSFHHQAVREIPQDFQVSAISSDGMIEAIESKSHHFVMGVQWHPESMKNDSVSLAIFKAFILACMK
ncbi:MAG: gamma-glutamyl-gamma-aminobutyrate hydrolase family protein [Paenisporosarcina sp.]